MENEITMLTLGPGIDLASKCLTLISNIATRAVLSRNPEQMGYALQEISQVLLERSGIDDILFEPIAADRITGLDKLHTELDWVDGFSQDMATLASS